jgi:hypothetical protein
MCLLEVFYALGALYGNIFQFDALGASNWKLLAI